MKCTLLKELYIRVVLPNFEEGFLRKSILWSLKRVPSYEEGYNELIKVYDKVIETVEEHIKSRGQLEKLSISGGVVTDRGVKLSEIKQGRFIRGLCYVHNSQYFIRIYLKTAPTGFILTIYGDLCENTPWLTELVNPCKLHLN